MDKLHAQRWFDFALERKKYGNDSYKRKKYDDALSSYRQSLAQVEKLLCSDNENPTYAELAFDLQSNILQTVINLQQFGGNEHKEMRDRIESHGALLEKDVLHKVAKAVYRIAKFYYHSQKWRKGLLYVGAVFELDPKHKQAQELKESCFQLAEKKGFLKLLPANESDDSTETCRICYESLASTGMCQLKCGRIYHTECIRKWWRWRVENGTEDGREADCPVCRSVESAVADVADGPT